jgi:subtilase family serine protease
VNVNGGFRVLLAVMAVVTLTLTGTPAASAASGAVGEHGPRAPITRAIPAPTTSVRYAGACSAPAKDVRCAALRRTDVKPKSEHALAAQLAATGSGTVSGYGPSDLQSAYNVAAAAAFDGSGQTVAIVDAYDDPNAEADLATHRSQFGLPPCTTANGCFKKLNQNGATSPLPAPAFRSDDWTLEESLDLDMVSAICPRCHILLVEANNEDLANMGTAVNATVAAGAKFVSNSYAASEQALGQSAEAQDDASYYDHPGVVITAASGDWGYGPWYPAASRYVTAVGGTRLLPAANARGWTESVWSTTPFVGTGSGCSLYEAKPSWQGDVGGCANRTIADVSAVAGPATGVAVYDTFNGEGGWNVVGGTSVATPLIASIYALAGTPATGSMPAAYPYSHTANLYDVSNGATTSCKSLLPVLRPAGL